MRIIVIKLPAFISRLICACVPGTSRVVDILPAA